MMFSLFLAVFLPCVGMSVVFVVYMCLLWYSTGTGADVHNYDPAAKKSAPKGLTSDQLKKLPKVTGNELVMGNECAVCLDEIEGEQLVRLVPGCNHGFHLECADAWLSKHPVCPVCRAKLGPDMFDSEASPC